jgi:hypothetical protein
MCLALTNQYAVGQGSQMLPYRDLKRKVNLCAFPPPPQI